MVKEFLQFIRRGNVLDLAVAVVVGGAFGAITTSLVNDIITPIAGLFMGGVDFSSLSFGIGEAQVRYGSFIQAIVNFLIIAWVVFLIMKTYSRLSQIRLRPAEAEPTEPTSTSAPAPPSREQVLLEEIRDLLAKQSK